MLYFNFRTNHSLSFPVLHHPHPRGLSSPDPEPPPPPPARPGALGKPPWRPRFTAQRRRPAIGVERCQSPAEDGARLAGLQRCPFSSLLAFLCVYGRAATPGPPAGAPPPEAPSPRCRLRLLRGPGHTQGHTFVRHFVTSSWRHQRGAEAPREAGVEGRAPRSGPGAARVPGARPLLAGPLRALA